MERILYIKIAKNVEVELNQISKKLTLFPLNLDRLISNRLFHQKLDLPDKNYFK